MPAYCCVPGCASSSARSSGVSFHEIPSNNEVRKKWLKVISRSNWIPNENCNYSRVCSLHFLSSDYKEGTKRKILLPLSVPSVFPNYPAYKQPKTIKPRGTSSITKRESATPCMPIQKRSRLEDKSCSSELANTIDSGLPASTSVNSTTDVGVQVQVKMNFNVQQKKDLILLKRKLQRAHEKIRRLEDENAGLMSRLSEKLKEEKQFKLTKILEQAESNDIKATLLLDMVQNFNKKIHGARWSETTIRHCIMWRNTSPKGYDYARQKQLIDLPCESTLSRYNCSVTDENDVSVSDLVKQHLCVQFEQLSKPQEKICSLVTDEMAIQERLTYHKQTDRLIGEVDHGSIELSGDDSNKEPSNNRPSC